MSCSTMGSRLVNLLFSRSVFVEMINKSCVEFYTWDGDSFSSGKFSSSHHVCVCGLLISRVFTMVYST